MKIIETRERRQTSDMIMKYGMCACCVIMVAPVILYFAEGGFSGGMLNSAIVFALLLVCLGAHFAMHRLMGKSCHGAAKGEEAVTAKTQIPIGQTVAPE
ncbi:MULTISPECIES: DUF2933 domain-containing protein [Rhodobacterales]|nr:MULTISPECIES: DUF2933 domain-containing protein [Rhodobacterales]